MSCKWRRRAIRTLRPSHILVRDTCNVPEAECATGLLRSALQPFKPPPKANGVESAWMSSNY